MRRLVVVMLGVLAGCKVLPPLPVVPFHASTAADPEGETSVTVVLGVVTEGLGGGGLGLAVRVERQETEATSLGLELTAGRADADPPTFSLFALRGFGRTTPRGHDAVALTYGLGVTILSTGMSALTAHGGIAIAYPNDTFVPYLSTNFALSVPMTQGDAFGDMNESGPGGHPLGTTRRIDPILYLTFDPGFAFPLGNHEGSLDLGIAKAVSADGGFVSLSVADRVH